LKIDYEDLKAFFGTEAALILTPILALLGFLICKWIGEEIKDIREFYLKTPTLTKNELELMQNSESSDELIQSAAQETLDAMEQDVREALATSYSLHKTVQQLAENRLWFIYKGFVQRTLSSISRLFGESFQKPRLNASELTLKSSSASAIPTIHWQQWFTLQSYAWLLLLAVAYPFVFALLNSLTTNTLNLSSVELIAFGDGKPVVGYLVLLLVSFMLAYKWAINLKAEAPFFRTWSWFGALLLINLLVTKPIYGDVAFAFAVAFTFAVAVAVAFAIAGAVAGAVAGAGAGAVAGAVAVAVAVTVAVAGAVAGAVAFAVAFAVAVAVAGAFAVAVALAYALDRIESKGKNTVLRSLLVINLLLLLYYAGVLFAITEYGDPDKQHMRLLPIFLGVLPLFNALIDWLSFNVTRLLTYKILHEKHSLIMNIGYGLLDAALAVVFVLLVTSTVLFGLTGLNHLFAANIVDLSVLMQGLGDPARISEHYWIHAMVLSTLVPTLFHLLLVCFSLLLSSVMFWKRAAIDTFLTKSITDRNNRKGLLIYVQFRWFLVAASAAILGYLLYLLVGQMGGLLCDWWVYADKFAQYSDALFGTLSGERLYTPATSVCKV